MRAGGEPIGTTTRTSAPPGLPEKDDPEVEGDSSAVPSGHRQCKELGSSRRHGGNLCPWIDPAVVASPRLSFLKEA